MPAPMIGQLNLAFYKVIIMCVACTELIIQFWRFLASNCGSLLCLPHFLLSYQLFTIFIALSHYSSYDKIDQAYFQFPCICVAFCTAWILLCILHKLYRRQERDDFKDDLRPWYSFKQKKQKKRNLPWLSLDPLRIEFRRRDSREFQSIRIKNTKASFLSCKLPMESQPWIESRR